VIEISQAPGKAKKESKEKKAKKSTTEVSKDEEAVKRLKVFLFTLTTTRSPADYSLLISHMSMHAAFVKSGLKNSKIFLHHYSRLSGSRKYLPTSAWMGGSAWRKRKLSKLSEISRRSLVSRSSDLSYYPLRPQNTEDVKSFEQAVVGEPSRNRSKATSNNRKQGSDSVSRDGDGDGSASDSANDVPTKHKVSCPANSV
jgi:hypothetical protein